MSEPHEYLRENDDIGPLVDRYGVVELDVAEDLFERLVVSITNQLISSEAARTIRTRLFESVEVTPEGVLKADDEILREAGLSSQKIEAIRNAAAWFRTEDVTRTRFEEMTNEDAIEELTTVSGVGEWTAKMVLLFGLGRGDVFPVEDLAVRRAMESLYGDTDRAAMCERAEAWRPYRSVATLYLWRHYEN